jgi:desulfoferrodoxin
MADSRLDRRTRSDASCLIYEENRRSCVANQVGKRYQCSKCNSEMIVTKAGEGALGCCGQPMQQKN